jgi:hypothetical protein
MSEDFVTQTPLGDTFYGKAGFLDAVTDWVEGFAAWSITPEEFIDAARTWSSE